MPYMRGSARKLEKSWFAGEPVTCGIPLAHGQVRDAATLTVVDAAGKPVPAQIDVVGTFRDGTPRWVRLDFAADLPARGDAALRFRVVAETHSRDQRHSVQARDHRSDRWRYHRHAARARCPI